MKYIAVFLRQIGKEIIQTIPVETEKTEKIKNKTKFTLKTKLKEQVIPNYDEIGRINIKSDSEIINFKGEPFYFIVQAFSYQDKKARYYYYDFDSGEIIGFRDLSKWGIIPKDLKKFTGRTTLEGVLNANKEKSNSSILLMILPVIMLIIGLVIGFFMKTPETVYVPYNNTSVLPTV